MKEILEKIYYKHISSVRFIHEVEVHCKQYTDKEIYETEVYSPEPCYHITFSDGSTSVLSLSEIIAEIFNYALTH